MGAYDNRLYRTKWTLKPTLEIHQSRCSSALGFTLTCITGSTALLPFMNMGFLARFRCFTAAVCMVCMTSNRCSK